MRLNKLSLLACLCAAALFASVLPVHAYAMNAMNAMNAMPSSYQKMAETDSLELYADPATGYFALKEKADDYIWWSNPVDRDSDKAARGLSKMKLNSLLYIRIIDEELGNEVNKTSKTSSVEVTKIANGVREWFHFTEEKISIPLDITLNNDYMSVSIPVKSIQETGTKKILDLYVLPYFGAGGPNDDGYLFVPDGPGALIHFNNGKSMYSYNERIYGRDKAYVFDTMKINKSDVYMPVYGLKNGDHSYLAVVQDGDALGSVNAMTNGFETSYNNVFSSYTLRSTDVQSISPTVSQKVFEKTPPAADQIAIRFYPLSGDDSDYSGMARRYRKYLLEDMHVKPRENSKSPLLLDIYGAVLKTKPILGFPVKVTEPLTTYRQSVQMVHELKDAHVDDMVVDYINWDESQLKHKIPTTVKPLTKLGGESEFKKLTDFLSSNHIEFFGNESLAAFANSGNGVQVKQDAVRALSQEPSAQYTYNEATYYRDLAQTIFYLLKPSKLVSMISTLLHSFSKHHDYGISVGDIGSKLYSDFHKNQPAGREETKNSFEDTFKQIKNADVPMMVNGGFAYSFPYARYIRNAPVKSSQFLIADEVVPFYQIALSGLAYYSVPSINQDASPTKMFLKAIETGSQLKYSVIYRSPDLLKDTELEQLYSSNFEAWKNDIIEQYREMKKVEEKVNGSRLYSHRKIADGVYRTQYENGTAVIVNYLDEAYTYEGMTINPLSYLIQEGGAAANAK